MPIFAPTITADMAKLVDVPDLGSGAARRVGSSPIIRTKTKLLKIFQKLCCFNIFFQNKDKQKRKSPILFLKDKNITEKNNLLE
jgi:hypothetical protein